jgi:hypothetical protein
LEGVRVRLAEGELPLDAVAEKPMLLDEVGVREAPCDGERVFVTREGDARVFVAVFELALRVAECVRAFLEGVGAFLLGLREGFDFFFVFFAGLRLAGGRLRASARAAGWAATA